MTCVALEPQAARIAPARMTRQRILITVMVCFFIFSLSKVMKSRQFYPGAPLMMNIVLDFDRLANFKTGKFVDRLLPLDPGIIDS